MQHKYKYLFLSLNYIFPRFGPLTLLYYQFFLWSSCPIGPRSHHLRSFAITLTYTHHTRYDPSGRVISPLQRPLRDNTQPSQQTDSMTPAGFETTIPTSDRLQTHTLDRVATGIGCHQYIPTTFTQ